MNAMQTQPSEDKGDRRVVRKRRGAKESALRRIARVPKFQWAKLSPTRLARKFIRNPARGVAAFIESFAYAWRAFWRGFWQLMVFYWTKRGFHRLVWGLPALLLGLAVIYGSVSASRDFERELMPKYEQQAKDAYFAKDYKKADLFCRRLVRMGAENEYRYMQAVTAMELGQKERGQALMAALAPLDRKGYYEAHAYQGLRIFEDKALAAVPANVDRAIIHLEKALEDETMQTQRTLFWHDKLGLLYLGRGRPDLAEKEFKVSASQFPGRRLDLAAIYLQRKDKEKAAIEGEHARQHFAGEVKRNPADDAARIQLANSWLVMGKTENAINAIQEGLLTRKDSVVLHEAMATCLVRWARELLETQRIGMGDFLRLITDAIKHDPRNPQAMQLLVNVTSHQGKNADTIVNLVKEMLANGVASSQCHLILGNYAHLGGDHQKAKFHFEQALKLNPDAAQFANNLAFALMMLQPPDLQRASQLIDSAIAKEPNNASYLDTRGQIRIKMGKYKEALEDLQKALEYMPRNPATHRALTEAYEKLGDKDMAALHRKLVVESERGVQAYNESVDKVLQRMPVETPKSASPETSKTADGKAKS